MSVRKIEPAKSAADETHPSDHTLVAALAKGDPEPLGELYVRHGAVVFSVLRRYGAGVADAELEDLRQEVFLTALQIAPRYRQSGTVRSWLCGIAVQLGRNRRRSQGVRARLLATFGGERTGLAREHEDPMEGATHSRLDAQRALQSLPTAQREVMMLHVVESLTGAEIADILGIQEKTVWTRLHRARKTMREGFERDELAVVKLERAGSDTE